MKFSIRSFPGPLVIRASSLVIVLLAAFSLAPSTLRSADFPHWRGPRRNDHIAEDSGYDTKAWPLKEPVWKRNVGEGSTSPIVAAGKLYVLGWKQDRDTLHCLDAASGESVWTQSYESPRYARFATGDEGLYSGVTSTPEYDPATKLLYTLSTNGELRCWNTAKQGELVWRTNLYDEYKMPQRPKIRRSGLRDYGYTTSPLVYNDWLLVEVGGERGAVMAFEKRSGRELWGSEHRGFAGHTGGLVPLEVEKIPCVAVLTLRELVVLRLDEVHIGQTVATYPWETDWANNILTPTVCGDSLLVCAYHTHHAICRVRITLGKADKVWQVEQASSVGSPIVDSERIYLGGPKLHCLDAASGKLLWEGGDYAEGASLLLTQDQRLIALGSNSRLALIESAVRSPDKYRELAAHDHLFRTDAWPHIVLANSYLYAKDRAGNLQAYALK